MAAHEKFVLKERQRLQAKEKELEKKEADAAAIKERLAAVEVELKSKSAQKGETRTRQMQNDQLRRKAGMTPSSSTGTAAPRRKGSSPDNPGMQRLP